MSRSDYSASMRDESNAIGLLYPSLFRVRDLAQFRDERGDVSRFQSRVQPDPWIARRMPLRRTAKTSYVERER